MRADGKRVKNADPMYTVAPFIMDKRYDSMNMIELDIPVAPIQKYINEKRKEGINISHMAVILAAYVRTMGQFPSLNRFIVNKRIYARNEIAVGMVVLQNGKMDNGTMSKMYFDYENTIMDVNNIINDYVGENRVNAANNGTEKIIKFLLSVPGILPVGVALFKWLDKHGLLPKAIIDASPFHTSLVISNLASIRTNHIYHHVYEFGTTGVIITMGNSREVAKTKNGEVTLEKCMPLGIVMDERICSGSYYALAFRTMKKYLKDPSLLEQPPEKLNIEVPQKKKSKYAVTK
ncbi:MAG: 2-oxo acid dehydrogenase subunit E2 [Ruminococcaceae bacterium]|nr:2-oxo acid dehydrogenase subunit E2 [Oscillospiraceae bacterium]